MKESPRPPRTFLDCIIEGKGLWHNPKKLFPQGRTRAVWVQPQGCKGRSPLHKITLVSPFPAGEGGWGDRGQKTTDTASKSGNQGTKPPANTAFCRPGSAAGVPGAVAPGETNNKSPPSPPGKSALRARVGGISFPFGEGGQKTTDTASKSGNQTAK